MSGSTINSRTPNGVTLGTDGYTSPLTIEPVTFSGMPPNMVTVTGGLIFAYLSGTAGVYSNIAGASIFNQGDVYGARITPSHASTGGDGLDLFGGGTLTNTGIIGGGYGSGGSFPGVNVSGGSVFNSGTIRGGYQGGTGLTATNAYVLNNSAGTITGGFSGASTSSVGVNLNASTLVNNGSITAGYPGGSGARLYGASLLTNNAKIIGGNNAYAVYIKGGTVLNTANGRIQPAEIGGGGVDLLSGATLTNQGTVGLPANYLASGPTGAVGVYLSAGAVLTNTGEIYGLGANGTLPGGTGVVVKNDTFTNAGTINGGAGFGVPFGSTGFGTVAGQGGIGLALDGGGVTNTGQIKGGTGDGSGTAAPPAMSGAGVLVNAGTLINASTIAGGAGGYKTGLGGVGVSVVSGSVVNNATIIGGSGTGGLGVGANIAGGSLTNSLTIAGSDGIDLVTAASGSPGYVLNLGTISGFINDGVSMAVAGTLVNAGKIFAPTIGVAMSAGGVLTNALTGTITAASFGVSAAGGADVVNLGSILANTGTGVGVSLSGGTLTNGSGTDKTADIAGGATSPGVSVTGGSLTNYAIITAGAGEATNVSAGVTLTGGAMTNDSSIAGGAGGAGHGAVDFGTGDTGYTGGAGVSLTNATLTNNSTITGGAGGMGGYGVYDSAEPGAGGLGGLGLRLSGGSVGNSGLITGGAGGAGGERGINTGTEPNGANGSGGGGARVNAGSLTNSGTVAGNSASGSYGIYLAGGSITNTGLLAGGAGLSGGTAGAGLVMTAGSVANSATIKGGVGVYNVVGGTGVSLTGGSLTNTGEIAAGAGAGGFYSVIGGVGLFLSGGTVTTSGTIAGGVPGNGVDPRTTPLGDAVLFGSVAAALIVDPGAVFTGSVVGDTAAADGLVLAGSGSGSLNMAGTFSGLASIQFDTGVDWTLSGSVAPLASGAAIDGFTTGDTIMVEGFSETGYQYVPGTGLELSGMSASPTLAIAGAFSTANFHVSTDGTNSTVTVTCYAAGTGILTPAGEIAAEVLRPGDTVVTADGAVAPVVSVRRRRVDCIRHPRPDSVWPVRVAAHAFGTGAPHRDLFLSPDHAVYLDGALIPVKYLINDGSIAQVPMDDVTYVHVELPAHDLLMAEGVAAESYLEPGVRNDADGQDGSVRLHSDAGSVVLSIAARWEANGCAPLLTHGPRLAAIRRWISMREQAKAA